MDWTISPRGEAIQELLPQTFRFSNENHISISAGLSGQQRHVWASQRATTADEIHRKQPKPVHTIHRRIVPELIVRESTRNVK